MKRFALLLSVVPLVISAGALAATSQEQSAPSRIEAEQIEPASANTNRYPERKAYHGDAPSPSPRIDLMQVPGGQISRGSNAPPSQITAARQSGPHMAQLSREALDATLAQLSAAERQVLLQAIAGSDICDNPPNVPAVLTLCRNRIETRATEFAEAPAELSAEEQLIRFDLDNGGLPSVGQVIERLARGTGASDDFANQAIASIALTDAATIARPDEKPEGEGLSQETQALINAIINQLGGSPP